MENKHHEVHLISVYVVCIIFKEKKLKKFIYGATNEKKKSFNFRNRVNKQYVELKKQIRN